MGWGASASRLASASNGNDDASGAAVQRPVAQRGQDGAGHHDQQAVQPAAHVTAGSGIGLNTNPGA